MYTKTKEINQKFSIVDNRFQFSENGELEFTDSSFIAFKKLNSYIDKQSSYLLKIVDKTLEIFNHCEQYCFSIIKREFIEAKSDKQIFTDSIIKKYAKYFKHKELYMFQENNRLFLFDSTYCLELHENFTEDFQTSNCQEKHINLTKNCVLNDFSSNWFSMPKSLTFDKNININLDDEIIFNSFQETIKIKTSETLKNTLNFNHCQKIFKLWLGEKIQLFQRVHDSNKFFYKIEKKNFTVYGLLNS